MVTSPGKYDEFTFFRSYEEKKEVIRFCSSRALFSEDIARSKFQL